MDDLNDPNSTPPSGDGSGGTPGAGGAGAGGGPGEQPPQGPPQPLPHGDQSGTPVGGSAGGTPSGMPGGAPGGMPAGVPGAGATPGASGGPGAYSQQIAHSPVSARVPERVARGVMTTGVIVLDSPNEFVLDFLQGLSRPPSIAARVVLPPAVMFSFVASVRDNLGKYTERFGPPAPLPKPQPQQPRPSIQELYEHFKLPEDLMSGAYANSVLIGHSPSEFLFDFITGFYPTASVSCRVFLSAQQVPRTLETLNAALATYQKRFQPRQAPQPPPAPGQNPHGPEPTTG